MEENKYPCTECKDNDCNRQSKYKRCRKWRLWFHREWRWIQKFFAPYVSNRHNEKGGDDK